MRTRAARLVWMAMGLLALGAAAFLIVTTERPLAERRERLRTFDLRARDTATLFADLRAAQQAYVAVGQSSSYWIPKVATLLSDTGTAVDTLRGLASSAEAGQVLIDVSSSVASLGNVDKRAREYLASDQALMAGDIVFTEAGETAAEAARQIETARLAEHQAFETLRASSERRLEYVLGAAAGVLFFVIILLGMAPAPAAADVSTDQPAGESDLPLQATTSSPAGTSPAVAASAADAAALLAGAAAVCRDLGAVKEPGDLKDLLARAGRLMDSSGVVVWLGTPTGADLQPVVAFGYADQVLGRMKTIPRSADNAVAAAYRSSALQTVKSSGATPGAVVAPIVSVDGCIGALTAETRGGRESSPAIQALATIFAAQLASVLGGAVPAEGGATHARAQSA